MSLNPAVPVKAFQWDLARQVERLDWLIAQLPRYAEWGYQELYLHLEDSVEYPSLPGVARAGAYSYRELAQLVWAATRVGIGVVPIVNLLGHTQYLIKVPSLRDLNECRAPDGSPLARGQICPLHPRTLEVAQKLMRDMAPFCTAGKVHVGLDESYNIGRHPLSRSEIARIGLAGHFAGHVGRLQALASGFGLRLGLWADMLALVPAAIENLPPGIIAYDWYYYPFRRLPRIELRNFAEYDLAPRLRARGIEYWGCAMNGAFRHEPMPLFGERLDNIRSWWRRCRSVGAGGFLVTSWEPGRLAAELPMTVDAAAASLWLDGDGDSRAMLRRGCERMFGTAGARAARAFQAADLRPFSGYFRWQLNERWDTVLSEEPLAPWRAEAAACRKLAAAPGLPLAFKASLRLRRYLAERDLFVRTAGRGVWGVRRSAARGDKTGAARLLSELERSAAQFGARLTAGRGAARAMWLRTRDRTSRSPNERMIAADAARLRAWIAWLRRARLDAVHARRSAPVAGAWQLLFTVAYAPAAQKVVLQRKTGDGDWEDLNGLFLIEFQAAAAHPRSKVVHRLSIPISWSGSQASLPRLRLCLRGFGRARLSDLQLTDGVRVRRLLGGFRSQTKTIGKAAPARGFPNFDWEENRGLWPLRFGAPLRDFEKRSTGPRV